MEKKRAYKKAFKKYKGSIKSLMYNSYDSAAIRYKELVKDLNFSNKSILDVGCGFGDIIPFIFSKSTSFKYTGIDIMKEFIQEAKKRYPEYDFVTGNYFKNPLKKKFDIIICCGALNSNYGKKTMSFRKRAIKTMFNHCKEAVAFNMAGGISPNNKKGSTIYYANSMDLLAYCVKLSKKIVLRNHYHEKDFTIVIFK
ncbi:MAG: hypothetical protein COZ28_02400 [Candidatus Moranbacteria bacterium CG_4_10_14_3_um_filter_44_15]|nr:MAG: hypothetical protein COS72_01820 [Candidatus Moranbacteria bacterium CG06_land_8_20_14_3_00_43_56]PIV83872.1 MAG: hypothetical protein COW51_02615 [Candidatus Moranbacteria bacterium CG17_big_fil_post_rev_8_21_14_2_50_44_12]PIW93586.1 MAG: hypothetical protein COZ87_00575 [Candidatus Moranbacteria bacterium CG_4_8_14_3_um_filter_43_15]PIX90708.1 MAG: hypothetical protein COZ28_02400 [Candidatus Moranbacteria bacterium CG_4_10_14_3_um_filter_44_15]PJA86090.1 MAG: hypothetical protein CO1